MRPTPCLLLVILLVLAAPAGPASGEATAPVYPASVGDAVGPQNHAHWPVRVRSLDAVRWTFRDGRHIGMAMPGAEGLVFVQAGGGGIRGVEAGTGKRRWYSAGNVKYWNYSTCVLGPGGIAYGGNYDWIQAVNCKGERLWRTELQSRWIHMPPAVSPDGRTVYVGGDGLGIAALDAATGHVNWLRRDFCSPDNVYVFDTKGHLISATRAGVFCFTARGKVSWSLPGRYQRLMLVDGLLLAIDKHGLHATDLQKRQRLWSWKPGPGLVDMARGDDGRILVTLDSGELASLETTGRPRWRRRLSDVALHRPVTTKGGETLVADMQGRLYLCDSNGLVLSSIDTGDRPYRWRPTVGPDGRVYLGHQDDRLTCIDGAMRKAPPPVVAHKLAIVADDFVVDVWVNGRKLPVTAREMVAEVHGAMQERVHFDLRAGDWIVFNVVANRMRWNGASYFGVHATGPGDEMAFVSTTERGWYACDDPSEVKAFITERDAGLDQKAQAPKNPWHDTARMWQSMLGTAFTGMPVWGAAPNTWIKCVVESPLLLAGEAPAPGAAAEPPPPPLPPPPRDPAKPEVSTDSRAYWQARLDGIGKGLTPEHVEKLVPRWNDGGGEGGSFTGGGFVKSYRVSARWLVQIGFAHQDGSFGGGGLVDIADPSNNDDLVCLVTERIHDGQWKTATEILVGSKGDCTWTRYPRAAQKGAEPRSTQDELPAAILAALKRAFAKGDRHYAVAIENGKVQHPEGVQALLGYVHTVR